MIAIIIEGDDKDCPHRSRVYQPEEPDTNVKESYTCDDCGVRYNNQLVYNVLVT